MSDIDDAGSRLNAQLKAEEERRAAAQAEIEAKREEEERRMHDHLRRIYDNIFRP